MQSRAAISRDWMPEARWQRISRRATASISGWVITSASTASGPGDRGGQAAVPVVPAFGERGMPAGFQPLPGDVLGLPVSTGDVLVGDVRSAPVVAALAVGDLGQGG